MDHTQHGRRGGHYHNRGRRGPDRRPRDRQPPPAGDQPARGERVDVEQIMREIRARISQRSGLDLSNQQIQELAARRLEAILDLRSVKPALLDQLRRTAGERPSASEPPPTLPPLFEEVMLYDSPNGLLRFIRRLLNPVLRLFFNPTPVAHSLAVQGRLHADALTRGTEQERRQAEWNALHYEILQRLVTEIARTSLEAQSLAQRVESLSAKVDFNDRRVRTLEGTPLKPARPAEAATPAPPIAAAAASSIESGSVAGGDAQHATGEGARRRRRRRRGRRGVGHGPAMTGEAAATSPTTEASQLNGDADLDSEPDDETTFDEPAVELHRMSAGAVGDEQSVTPESAPEVSPSSDAPQLPPGSPEE